MKARLFQLCSVILLCVASAGLAHAQYAEMTGRVTDPANAAVPGVAVTVTNTATGLVRSTEANDQGYYVLPLLPPGTYLLKLEKEGFKVVNQTAVKLDVAQ